MCLIIAKGKDGQRALLPRDVFDYAYSRNKDGFGAMWVEDGRVQHMKRLGMSADEIYSFMDEISERFPETAIFHLRYKTHGQIIPGLCHPFRILNKARHGKDLFMMHNGTISGFGTNLTHGQSDTTAFKDKILIPLLTRKPDALEDEDTFKGIEKLTQGSRLIFLDSDGKIIRSSDSSWNNRYDLTLSNTYMLPSPAYTGSNSSNYGRHNQSNVVPFDTGEEEPMRVYRKINGVGMWVTLDKWGYVKLPSGTMYKDGSGHVEKCDFVADAQDQSANKDTLDDELPGVLKDTTPTTDAKLRYARIVHNTHDGDVASREQMLGDMLAMSEREMASFVDEDPESASIFMAEMFEIIMELNTMLKATNDQADAYTYDEEVLLERGDTKNHQASMKLVMDVRRARYQAMIEEKRKAEEEARKVA